jgi:protein-tyrosine phosphatase
MFGWLKSKNTKEEQAPQQDAVQVDMHSHLLPAIDDGAKSIEESISLVKQLVTLGYKKLITTPHIMSDFYRNTPEIITNKLNLLKEALKNENVTVEIHAAAEYYLDEGFAAKVSAKEKLLTLDNDKKYILFETSYMNASPHFDNTVFELQSQGYHPVLAHPERYVYLFDNFDKLKKWYDKGILFQINTNSLNGYYSIDAKRIAEKLIDSKMVNFIGSDCHKDKHLQNMQTIYLLPYYKKVINLDLLNNTLQ